MTTAESRSPAQMPSDSTLLLGTSPPAVSFTMHSNNMYSPLAMSGHESDSSIVCRSPSLSRRIQTYPPQNHIPSYGTINNTNPLRIFMASALKNRSVSDSQHLHLIDTYTPPPSGCLLPDDGTDSAIGSSVQSTIDMDAVRRQLQTMAHQMPKCYNTPDRSTADCCGGDDICLQSGSSEGGRSRPMDEVELHHKHMSVSDKKADAAGAPPKSPEPTRKVSRRHVVRFADDVGQQLEEVRVMREPSDCPPKLDPKILRDILGEEHDPDAKEEATWQLGFAQPAGDYMKFRHTLEGQKVALENVVLRNTECRMSGTVRVKNVAFEKSVFIRYTDNNWLSYYDRPCEYKANRLGDPSYDTFTFTVDIPCDDDLHEHIAFCVCYKTGDGDDVKEEFWDSNGGANFSIMSAERKRRMESNQMTTKVEKPQDKTDMPSDPPRTSDAWALNMGPNWGNFSSWKNLKTESPYY